MSDNETIIPHIYYATAHTIIIQTIIVGVIMPNWVSTTIETSPEAIAIIKERFCSKDKYCDDRLDFAKVIPVPPDVCMGDVPLWDPNVKEPTTEVQKAAVKTISKLYGLAQAAIEDGGDPQAHLQAVLKVASQHRFDLDAIGCPVRTWYDWCPENWGTKWGASECSIRKDSLSFQTAWNCPEPVLAELSRQLGPDAIMVVKYADEEIGQNCGQYVLQGGEVTTQVEMEFGSREAIRFACDIAGRDFDEYDPDRHEEENDDCDDDWEVEGPRNTVTNGSSSHYRW